MRSSLVLCILLFVASTLMCEVCWADYKGALSELLVYRGPSPRFSALGNAAVLPEAGAFTGYYNPAGLAWTDGASLSWSRSTKFYLLEDAAFSFVGGAGNLGNLGTISFSRYELSYRWGSDQDEQMSSLLCLTYCRHLGRGFAAAASLARVGMSSGREDAVAYTTDVGALKVFYWSGKRQLSHRVIVSSGLLNFTGAAIEIDQIDNDLPIILRLGTAYSIEWSARKLLPDLTTVEASIQAEYYDLLNSDFNSRFGLGAEIGLFEMLALRLGYYYETRDDYGFDSNKDSVDQVTSGLGLCFPIKKISDGRVPFDAALDIARLRQPKVTTSPGDWPTYTHYSLSVNWAY
jgi:hypothetical protein